MYLQHILNFMNTRNINAAQLAKRAGVSRAAVSKWFATQEDFVNVETGTARQIAEVLGAPLSQLFEPLERLSKYKTAFLWDGLYPSMEDFLVAVVRRNPVAEARFVQVLGFFKAKAIFGKKIISDFPEYKQYVKPARRKGLETIWPLLVLSSSIREDIAVKSVKSLDLSDETHAALAKMVANLVSRVSEQDLFDLDYILGRIDRWDVALLLTAGSTVETGLNAESLLISLKGALLRKEACGFLLPDSILTVEQAFRTVTALRDKIVKDLLVYARSQPPTPIVKTLKTVAKDLKK